MLSTIHKINDILKEEGKNKNTENIITKTINGGKHAFDLIQFIHNTEVQYYIGPPWRRSWFCILFKFPPDLH